MSGWVKEGYGNFYLYTYLPSRRKTSVSVIGRIKSLRENFGYQAVEEVETEFEILVGLEGV